MIRKAIPSDYEAIEALIDKDERAFVMRHQMKPETVHVFAEEFVKGFAHVSSRVLNLHGKALKTSYIDRSVRDDGYFEQLLDKVSQKELITVLKTETPEKYEAYGFETVIENYEYNISATTLPEFSVDGIVLDPSNEDLVKVYRRFTQHFTGYFERDDAYFALMKKELSLKSGGGIVGLAENGILIGYAVFEPQGNAIVVRETCYGKSGHLIRLLSFVSRGKTRILLTASIYEHLNRILPDAKRQRTHFLIARINDKELFERLFHIKIISAYSGFNAFGKPLWNRDFY